MKKVILTFAILLTTLVSVNYGQKAIEPPTPVDPILEADANHNLDVSRQYFRLQKAYKAVLMRFEETYALHPEFSKMDEFLYLAAMSSKSLSENKGRTKLVLKDDEEKARYSPERMREDAIAYFNIIKEKYPNSKYIKEVDKQLKLLQPKE